MTLFASSLRSSMSSNAPLTTADARHALLERLLIRFAQPARLYYLIGSDAATPTAPADNNAASNNGSVGDTNNSNKHNDDDDVDVDIDERSERASTSASVDTLALVTRLLAMSARTTLAQVRVCNAIF